MNKVSITIVPGVRLNPVIHLYQHLTKTRREFVFYGVQIGWWMIGVTVVRKVKP